MYKGPLTAEQIAAGMNAARENARRLLRDATLLLKAEGYPSATALAILSIEESGKIAVLRRLAMANKHPDVIASTWRDVRNHRKKNFLWALPDFMRRARGMDDLLPLIAPDSSHAKWLDQLKQHAFYIDYSPEVGWSKPTDVVNADLATIFVALAEFVMGPEGNVTTVREIELLEEHLAQVRDLDTMKEGLIAWFNAMKAEGLVTAKTDNFERFVRGKLDGPLGSQGIQARDDEPQR